MIGKESIVNQYKNIVIKKKSSKVTVKEICTELNISRTTFYKYFKDTYEIMEDILVHDGIFTMNSLLKSNLDRYTITEGWYISFYKNKEFYYYAMLDESQNSLFNTLIIKLTEFNKNLYKDIIPDEDIEYYSYKYAASQTMLLKKWILEGMKVEPKKMAEYFINDLLNEKWK